MELREYDTNYCNLDAEKKVLGGILATDDINQARRWVTNISEEDFTFELHQKILHECQKMLIEGNNPCPVTIGNILDKETYLIELITQILGTFEVEPSIEILKDLTLRRKINAECREIQDKITDKGIKINEIISNSATNFKSLLADGNTLSIPNTREGITSTLKLIHKSSDDKTCDIIVPYCLDAVDDKLKHLRKQLHVISAYSGIGKTAWGLSCMFQQICKGMRVAYFCGESSKEEIIMRLLSIGSGVSFEEQITGLQGVNEHRKEKFNECVKILKHYSKNFFIFGKADYRHDFSHIAMIAENIASNVKLDMLYVDYLQNMRPPKHLRKSARYEQVEYDVMNINNLTGELNVATVLMSQLNRQSVDLQRPTMQSLKYSSTIENEAHIISFLYRDEEHGIENKDAVAPTEFYSDKVRLGGQFFQVLDFVRKSAKYETHQRYRKLKEKM